MGILSRFRQVMKANVNDLLNNSVNKSVNKSDDPEKEIDAYMRSLSSDLGQLRAEAASVQAEERRAKLSLDECEAELRKLQRYAEKSVEAGREEEALKFLERKAALAEKRGGLQTAFEQAKVRAEGMKAMQNKLLADLNRLETRRSELKGKLAEARFQQTLNASGGAGAAFEALEEKADLALNEAQALAELRGGAREDDLDTLIARLEQAEAAKAGAESGAAGAESGAGPAAGAGRAADPAAPSSSASGAASPEAELAALKAKINRGE
ncbi:PspA/IM30 family protein [Paenibacillus pinistramenti]|uniref:PspA/IM30 family protein n=1 Tax=Paenibacillus pinistramenti TaxID=1768003 RepID=UPI001939A709